jgi:type II secretory pathway component PulK
VRRHGYRGYALIASLIAVALVATPAEPGHEAQHRIQRISGVLE